VRAEVLAEEPYDGPKIISAYINIEGRYGNSLKYYITICKIHRISIESLGKSSNLFEFQVKAFDNQGNAFNSLSGREFFWSFDQYFLEKVDSNMSGSRSQEREDIIILKPLKGGSTRVKVQLNDVSRLENDIELSIYEHHESRFNDM
jgi:hypothetical protein